MKLKVTIPRTQLSSSNTSSCSVLDAMLQGPLIDTQQSSVSLPPHSPPTLGTELDLVSLLLLASLSRCLPSHLSLSQPGVSCVSFTFSRKALHSLPAHSEILSAINHTLTCIFSLCHVFIWSHTNKANSGRKGTMCYTPEESLWTQTMKVPSRHSATSF